MSSTATRRPASRASGASTINGIVVDVADTTELIGATVKVLRATKDSTMVKGTATDENGVFNIKGIGAGKYIVKFSYLGYTDVTRHVTVGNDGRDVNLGVVAMAPNSVMLKETVVMGVKTPITVKEDTIEYNVLRFNQQFNDELNRYTLSPAEEKRYKQLQEVCKALNTLYKGAPAGKRADFMRLLYIDPQSQQFRPVETVDANTLNF